MVRIALVRIHFIIHVGYALPSLSKVVGHVMVEMRNDGGMKLWWAFQLGAGGCLTLHYGV
jgi:hypothetical protein